jgi:hypothetical protein
MTTSLVGEVDGLRARLGAVDAGSLSGPEAALLVAALASLGKACDAARGRVGARAASSGVHREKGFADGADWLAEVSGVVPHHARREIELARFLDGETCGETRT